MSIAQQYLKSIRKQFLAYKDLGEKAMAQLTDAQFFHQPEENANSIAIIIQHLNGNMTSRFTNFLTEDGEKPWRNRDQEFLSPVGCNPTGENLTALWRAGWDCVFGAIDQLQPEQLLQTITIRQEPHLVVDALNRQLAHYSAHVGQIVYIAKMIRGKDFKSLSIKQGASNQFNQQIHNKFKKD
jgi:Protein of unknown function (DUF1572)